MQPGVRLDDYLNDGVVLPAGGVGAALAKALQALAGAAVGLARLVETPPLSGALGSGAGGVNSDGDAQRKLDVVAEDIFCAALKDAGVGAYLSEEVEAPSLLNASGLLAIAIDPLDGSSNIDVNAPIGTIFSIFPMPPGAEADPGAAFRQNGRAQLAAGFFIYGPQTSLVLTVGKGVQRFTLDRTTGAFVLVETVMTIAPSHAEYAINASNRRHWRAGVSRFVERCEAGADGPAGRNFNMRWAGSLVADAYRIFTRGGVFLYPGDARKGYDQGRLRLLYEVYPMAFLTEQAGGRATDGVEPILDRVPQAPHERAPLVMGSAEVVEQVRACHVAI